MEDCILCSIIQGKAPAQIVYDDEWVIGIVPLGEVSRGHRVILPKTHYQDLFDIDEATLSHLAVAARRIACDLTATVVATGINLLHASGKDAQQSVFHFHIHIVPRYPNDGLDLWIRQGM